MMKVNSKLMLQCEHIFKALSLNHDYLFKFHNAFSHSYVLERFHILTDKKYMTILSYVFFMILFIEFEL